MGILHHHLPSQPYARDLIGVAVYVLTVAAIAVALYAGARAAAPAVLSTAATTSDALDRWTEAEAGADHQPSNFQRWLADREAGKSSPLELEIMRPKPLQPVAVAPAGPIGVAAAARTKALSEIRSGRGGHTGIQPSRDDAALPPEARPAEQTGFTPPVRDQHRIY